MAYTDLHFCWHGIISTDVDRAASFYSEVLGWSVERVPMGTSVATMFSANGIPRAHLSPPPMAGVPSHWSNYLRVADVDAAAKAAAENGGAIMVPGTDIPPGRFAVVTSPSGGALSLFHEADPSSTNAPRDDMGGIHWVELHSTDRDADLAWLQKTFGLHASQMDMPEGAGPPGGYHILSPSAAAPATGGIMKNMAPGAPSFWLAWVGIDDVDAAVERVKANGGTAMSEPEDYPGIGRMAVVQDPTGGVFGVITPAAKA